MNLTQSLEISGLSHAGRVRAGNEDAVLADAKLGLVILADGMGGYNAGEVASGLATTVIREELSRAFSALPAHDEVMGGHRHAVVAVEEAISRANSAIFNAARGKPQYAGMGTTVVTVVFYDNALSVGHVGDSRLYRLRHGALQLLTRDHSLLQEQLDSGVITPEQARRSANRNLVTRALGADFAVHAEVREYDTLPGDIYLLCSDGLNDMLDDGEIAGLMQPDDGSLGDMAARLIDGANARGGRDNVSVILVRVLREYPARRGVMARLSRLFG